MTLAPADMLQDAVDMLAGEATLRIIHTHDGCRAGCMVAAYGSPKERKKLLKAIKGNAMKMASDNFAYVALVQVLRVVDDTQLVRKCAVQELAVRVARPCCVRCVAPAQGGDDNVSTGGRNSCCR